MTDAQAFDPLEGIGESPDAEAMARRVEALGAI